MARGRSSGQRRQLFQSIADLLRTDAAGMTDQERLLIEDILARLIDDVEADLRRQLAETLAETGLSMPSLTRLLIQDDIAIARPLLEHSTLLHDDDLIALIRQRGDEHRMLVAMRPALSEAVSDALVEYASADVITTLLCNRDAALSRQALAYLVAESRRIDQFRKPLLARADLPAPLAYRLYWWVSGALRRHILERFELDEAMLQTAIRRANDNALVELSEQSSTQAAAESLVQRMADNAELSFGFLLNALRQRRVPVFVAGLAHLAQVEFRTAWMVFSDPDPESLAILARAVGMGKHDFIPIHLLVQSARQGERAQSTAVVQRITDLFEAIDPDRARAALSYWQHNSGHLSAQRELERL